MFTIKSEIEFHFQSGEEYFPWNDKETIDCMSYLWNVNKHSMNESSLLEIVEHQVDKSSQTIV